MPVSIPNEAGQPVEYLSISEAAEVADRGKDTIRGWIRDGSLTAHQDASGRWLIKRSSLDDFLRGKSLGKGKSPVKPELSGG